MGSPASPVVADIVMEELLRESVKNLDRKPRLLTKYVDDLFAIVRENDIEETLNQLNKFHKRIKFTMEEEKHGQLPYLDTLVIRRGNQIIVDWYQKPTSSGRIINYFSCHPKSIIMNTASNLIRRVLSISDKQFHKENLRKLNDILRKNSFPKHIIKKLIYKNNNSKHLPLPDNSNRIYKSMTYMPKISERIQNSDIYNKEKYKIAPKTNNTLRQLFSNTKSRIDDMDKSNLIYKIKCMGDNTNICNQVYIGTTKNKLKTRLAGHRSDIRCRDKSSTHKTALTAHCAMRGHTPDFDNVQILQREEIYKRRFTLEMLHINKVEQEKRMNYRTDIENLSKSYTYIINKTK